jgi:hypothetical protein
MRLDAVSLWLLLFAASAHAAIGITISPSAQVVAPGGAITFQVVVTGDLDVASTSTVSPNIGTLVTLKQAQAGDRLTYTAPAILPGAKQQTVTITSVAYIDKTKTATAVITLMPFPTLSAKFSFLAPQAPASPDLSIWVLIQALPPGVECAVTYTAQAQGVLTYSGEASIMPPQVAVLLQPAMSPGDSLVGEPEVSVDCGPPLQATAAATPL